MNPLLEVLHHPVTQRLGWTLLNFIWQGALLAAFFAALRAAWRGRPANARYLAGCLTLLLMAAAPVATFWLLSGGAPSSVHAATPLAVSVPPATLPATVMPSPAIGISGRWMEQFGAALNSALPWLVAGWCLGVAVLSLRLALGWFHIRRARTQSGESLEAQLGARLRELQRRLRLSRPVRLVKSALVEVPTVIGWFRPMILLPASTLTGLSPVQIDLILAHELAHLRRWDQWVNLFQIAIETLLFYHPAVWWVSRCVRDEREHCCDELAVGVCGNRLAYAQALATLEELRQRPANLALAAAGGSLLVRIRRVLSLPDDERGGGRLAAAGSALMVVGMLMFGAGVVLYATSERLFTSTARIDVSGVPQPVYVSGVPQPTNVYDPDFQVRELAKLQSRSVLTEVVRRLGLRSRWSASEGAGELSEIGAVERLQRQLDIRQGRGSCLTEIRVYSADAKEAAEIANALAETFRDQRVRDAQQTAGVGIAVLEKNLDRQTEKVATLQQECDTLRAQAGLSSSASDEPSLRSELAQQRIVPLTKLLTESRNESASLSTQWETLAKLSPGELAQVLPYALPTEQVLPLLLHDRASVDQQLASKRQDFADENPEVRRLLALKKEVERQIAERVSGILAGLRSQCAAQDLRTGQLAKQVDATHEDVERTLKASLPYFQKRRELEDEQRVRDALYLRVLQEKVDASIPSSDAAKVEIVDRARPESISRRASHPLDMSLMAAGVFTTLSGLGMRLGGRKPGMPSPPAR